MRNENGNCHSKMKEIQSDHVGVAIYSTKSNRIVASYNSEINIPLASAKVVIGFVVAQMVKENKCNWNDILHHVKFNQMKIVRSCIHI